jgi:manganese transport protein
MSRFGAGTAIGLNLLFGIPTVPCIMLTGVDALAHLLILPQAGVRHAQQWTAFLVAAVLACFVVDLFISRPPFQAVLSGLLPSLHREGIYSAVSLLGANIMPHNFYLHSALVSAHACRDRKHTARLCYLNFVDISCALGLALLVNVAVFLVAASTFHASGMTVSTLQDAHDLLEQILNSRLAPLAFGLALLLTGQMSTFTGTIAGQVVLSGFMGVQSSTLARRLGTRALAIVPALIVQVTCGAPGTYKCVFSGCYCSKCSLQVHCLHS